MLSDPSKPASPLLEMHTSRARKGQGGDFEKSEKLSNEIADAYRLVKTSLCKWHAHETRKAIGMLVGNYHARRV